MSRSPAPVISIDFTCCEPGYCPLNRLTSFHERFWSNSNFILWRKRQLAFSVGRKGEAGFNVFASQFRKVLKNLILAHSAGEIFENVLNGDPHSANTWFAASFSGFYCDYLSVVHKGILTGIRNPAYK